MSPSRSSPPLVQHSRPTAARIAGSAAAALVGLVGLAGPAAADEPVADPWEPFNRSMFAVHETLDKAVLEPVARGYVAVTPAPVREGVGNVLDNLKAPVVLANDVLQFKPDRALTTTGRFLINSTLGIAGIFDVASLMGMQKHDEDFGQTLATWGVGEGPYLFVPVLGPSNLRDGLGRFADGAIDPLNTQDFRSEDDIRAARGALTGLQTRGDILDVIDEVRAANDPYLTIRTTYQFLRESEIRDGKADLPEIPEMDAITPAAPPQPQSPITPPQD
jgi:phospholipid-binding lipoprotein MlaA